MHIKLTAKFSLICRQSRNKLAGGCMFALKKWLWTQWQKIRGADRAYAKYLIRIDKLTDSRYRYASWKITEKESSKPDIILDNGELEADGNGGNHVITFSKDNYTYKIHRILMGAEGSPEVTLEVEKDGKLILAEDGELIME